MDRYENNNRISYVIITPAHNEAAYIEKTIHSMLNQTIKPIKWIIVSDGSTDRTDEIIIMHKARCEWIEFLRRPEHSGHHFAAKVEAFNMGYAHSNNWDYDIIGNLDADLSFEPDYMEFLLGKFLENPRLGVAGTPFIEESSHLYNYRFTNIEHVSGACQLFRKQCFEDIGGYLPIERGGIDWVAVTTARMKGWQTRTFKDKMIFHHRAMGTGRGNILKARFRIGQEDFSLGSHPFWQIFRIFYQMKHRPYIIGGVLMMMGYLTCYLQRTKRPIPEELVTFYRSEQMQRLRRIILKE